VGAGRLKGRPNSGRLLADGRFAPQAVIRPSDVMELVGRWPIAQLDSTFMNERPFATGRSQTVRMFHVTRVE
jgi:hypothetical protein